MAEGFIGFDIMNCGKAVQLADHALAIRSVLEFEIQLSHSLEWSCIKAFLVNHQHIGIMLGYNCRDIPENAFSVLYNDPDSKKLGCWFSHARECDSRESNPG
jgi:hypothetical protein